MRSLDRRSPHGVHRILQRTFGVVLTAIGLCAASVVQAAVPGASFGRHLLDTSRLLGDPAGARSSLERLGLDLQLFYNQFLSVKPSGGGANSGSEFGHSGSYDFFALADLEELTGWPGADVLFHAKGQYDRNLNAEVGAVSDPIDDADFDEGIYVDELWIQQALFDDRLRLRLGFMEQQTTFDRNAVANSEDRQFLASFLDNNPVVPLPNGLGATLLIAPAPWLRFTAGTADADNQPRNAGFDSAFDGVDSLNGYFEAAVRSRFARSGLTGNYRFGVFLDGRKKTHFRTGRRDRGHVGAYLSFDQVVWLERDGGFEGLALFARGGYADPDVNRVAWFWSVGFEYVGPLPGRSRDVLGFGSYQAIGSSTYRDVVDSDFRRETGLEFYYAIRVLGWLVVTPDLQYIIDPGATGASGDAFVGTLRFRVIF